MTEFGIRVVMSSVIGHFAQKLKGNFTQHITNTQKYKKHR